MSLDQEPEVDIGYDDDDLDTPEGEPDEPWEESPEERQKRLGA